MINTKLNPKNWIGIIQLLLLFLLIQPSLAQYQENLKISSESSTSEVCPAPQDVMFTIYDEFSNDLETPSTTTYMTIEWTAVQQAINYKVSVTFDNSATYNYTSNTNIINFPLQGQQKRANHIEVCVTTICDNNLKSNPTCVDRNLTTIATISPVYGANSNPIAQEVLTQVQQGLACEAVSFCKLCDNKKLAIPYQKNDSLMVVLQHLSQNTGNISKSVYCDNLLNLLNNNFKLSGIIQMSCMPSTAKYTLQINHNSKMITLSPQISPNPFTTHTQIHYELQEKSSIHFHLFDLLGQPIQHISKNQSKGKQNLLIDGSDLASGIYYYKFIVNGVQHQGKLIKID